MSTRERELCLLVHDDGEGCLVEVPDGMAAFAAVFVGLLGELTAVDVLVAVDACTELDVVDCVFPGRGVALGALNMNVLPLQRIR